MPGLSGLSGISGESGVFGGAFSPLDIAGLILWLKADAGTYQDSIMTTPASSDGDPVGGWEDQSGNGNDMTQAVAANKPTLKLNIKNGLPVLRFDGAADYLQNAFATGALSQPVTVFAVAALSAGDVNVGTRFLLDSDDLVNRLALEQRNQAGPDTWDIYAGVFLDGSVSNSNWNIWSTLFNGAASQIWINGISVGAGDAGAHNADGLTVGANPGGANRWTGDISEVLIYDPSLSADNRQLVEQYLSSRWAI